MPNEKRRNVESTVAAIQQRHGQQAIQRASEMPAQVNIPHISTAFPALDALTGCQGAPLGYLTLLSGQTTSGKLTLAYKILANGQHTGNTAFFDLTRSADPDYLVRCGIDLDRLLIVRPQNSQECIPMLLDVLQSRQVKVIVLDGLAELNDDPTAAQALINALSHLQQRLRAAGCALLCIDEASPAWRRWLNLDRSAIVRQAAVLHISLQRERWLRQNGALVGYAASAQVMHSRWQSGSPSTTIEFTFNGAVRARETW
jgi:hypothetical protein